MSKPTYRLRELIYLKYGEAKFALGCEIVSRWVSYDIKDIRSGKLKKWNADHVQLMCNTVTGSNMTYEEAESLRQLFGLSTVDDLYN